ncbi:acrylate utilization transcriptional regulator AcuR [Vibrio mangrovi]|uniref:TetR/AcrR family transcriptional regulator n=1 Tax=Vibrio mangrovi TaxID=474394 RepID=A0A1Y6IR65_9VIBR|nr:TetR/AcrR family transcriptional regulator [Vibrio mangrovi]MDW6001839.1 TetR/AcrR family transcriptional regulator [Vibrio mangrovi]SMS00134.1 Transcriptional regulator AcuR [Vibrio mangrovi]
MVQEQKEKRGRGRPPKIKRGYGDTRDELIRSGLALITQNGFMSAGIDSIVKSVQVPKGSFYHYFQNKEAFGHAVLESYGCYFARKLDKHLQNETLSPLSRIESFVTDAKAGMARYDFKRGCLVGNMMQEVPQLSEEFSQHLQSILMDWQTRLANCLSQAKTSGEIPDTADEQQLAVIFWSGWEGAVMRSKLFQSVKPLDEFWTYFQSTICIRK